MNATKPPRETSTAEMTAEAKMLRGLNALFLEAPEAVVKDLIELCGAATREAEAKGAEREREQCCKDVCHWCARGHPTKTRPDGNYWHQRPKGADTLCRATPIRNRSQT